MISMRRQSGMTMVICLIFLVLMTLFALTTFKAGSSSLLIVGNMQQRNQTLAAANSATEGAISSTRFFQSPAATVLDTCTGPNTQCYDVNGDGNPDVNVALSPAPHCLRAKTIKNATLDLSNADDAGCSQGVTQNFGAGASNGDSLCANSLWEVRAVASDATTQAKATVTQGVSLRVSTDSITASCP